MSDIFISYTRSDKKVTKALAEVFEQQGWSVWWDTEISTGETFADVIEKELDSSKCVVVLWSKSSIKKRWVKTEASEGAIKDILAPVKIEEVTIPLEFRQIHAANLIGWQGEKAYPELNKLIVDVEKILGIPRRDKSETKQEESKKIEKKTPEIIPPIFRSTPEKRLSAKSVKAMLKDIGFFDNRWNDSASGFSNDYELQSDGKVVIDRASGLTWQQSGSEEMIYDKAKAYVTKLNSEQFAGYNDWRLPTIEEAMSLMKPEKKAGEMYIDTIFDSYQRWIWTSDLPGASVAWVVDFRNGDCSYYDFSLGNYVRAVR